MERRLEKLNSIIEECKREREDWKKKLEEEKIKKRTIEEEKQREKKLRVEKKKRLEEKWRIIRWLTEFLEVDSHENYNSGGLEEKQDNMAR